MNATDKRLMLTTIRYEMRMADGLAAQMQEMNVTDEMVLSLQSRVDKVHDLTRNFLTELRAPPPPPHPIPPG